MTTALTPTLAMMVHDSQIIGETDAENMHYNLPGVEITTTSTSNLMRCVVHVVVVIVVPTIRDQVTTMAMMITVATITATMAAVATIMATITATMAAVATIMATTTAMMVVVATIKATIMAVATTTATMVAMIMLMEALAP